MENTNTALGSKVDVDAILREFFARTKDNRKEKVWADNAAYVINIYSRFLKFGVDKEIEFGDLRYFNSSGWFSRFNTRIYRSQSRPNEYRVRFMADRLEEYRIRGRKIIFESDGNTIIMVESDEQFFINADGVDFQDYLARCRVREIRTLQKYQNLG